MTNQSRVLQAVLRQDLPSFIRKCFTTINPGVEYEHNWHIDLIAQYLNSISSGDIKRLIINIPPRSLKSVCISVAWPAWLLGHFPDARIIVASYSQTLSIKHSLDCKIIMESSWYKELFPQTKISKKHNLKSKFMTTKYGFRFATSVEGSLTGEGGDYLIIDDPHNPTSIYSQVKRQKVIDWFEQTFATRLNNKKKGAIVIVMQRLHDNDLCGYLFSKNSNWNKLIIPVEATKQQTYAVNGYTFTRFQGELLQQSRIGYEEINQLEQDLGTSNFAAQYQQQPLNDSSSMLRLEDINYYEQKPINYDYIIQSWDTAIKIGPFNDFSVCSTWLVKGNKFFLLEIFRAKLEYSDLKLQIIDLAARFNPRQIIIEDKASGQALLQDLAIETKISLIKFRPKFDKITRFAACVPFFRSNRITFPIKKPWLNDCLKELTTFPMSKNDDIVDSISQFIMVMKTAHIEIPRIRSI